MTELLAGVRVVELGILFNGDYLGMLLGDMGAEVIKVEDPARGDYLREMHGHLAPHWSPTHLQANRNKRSVGLDVRDSAGRAAFWRLLETADVFVDGLATGACDRMGIGYAEQRKYNPRIIYCQHTGFGAIGPYATLPTHGVMPKALIGSTPMAMGPDGFLHPTPTDELLGGTTTAGDATITGALFGAAYVAAALHRRGLTGEGAWLDISSADAALGSTLTSVVVNLNRERLVDLDGMPTTDGREWRGAKYQYYETRDHRVVLFCCIERKFWQGFCRAISRIDLIESADDDFDYGDAEDLRRELQNIFSSRTLAEWMALATEHRLPIGPAHRSVQEMRVDPQLQARGVLVDAQHPAVGPFTYFGSPVAVDGKSYQARTPAPGHGEHTRAVLEELGFSSAEITELIEIGAARDAG
jgi:crotonobetainyl-CoA:carnitine CoA-transferase CaiB-like acyl-CoA transferase